MTKKSEAAYQTVFEYVNMHLFDMRCGSFMSDFESAIRNALRTVVPGVPTYGCWFHFSQALQKRAAKQELVPFFRKNDEARSIYKRLRFLALLPEDQIVFGFNLLKQQATDLQNIKLDEFIKYINSQWIMKVRPISKYK